MNKLSISSIILCLYCAGLCTSDVIPVAVESHRQFDDVDGDYQGDGQPWASSHVFEVEPSTAPLRIVFSSESSPLSLAVEKVFRDTPLHGGQSVAPDAKQDRRGAIGSDARPVNSAEASGINEDEYEIVDSYSRYVPVKVREHTEEQQGSDEQVVFVKPVKVVKPQVAKQKVKKVKIPVIKVGKLTTSKPVAAKQVAAKPTASPKTTPAEQMTSPASTTAAKDKDATKFGARIARQTKKEEKAKKA